MMCTLFLFTYNAATPVGIVEAVYVVTDNFPEEKNTAAEEQETPSHCIELVDNVDNPLSGQGLRLGRLVKERGGQKVHHPRHIDC